MDTQIQTLARSCTSNRNDEDVVFVASKFSHAISMIHRQSSTCSAKFILRWLSL